jgi:hypothetical protein
MMEIRLYAIGHTRQVDERFDVTAGIIRCERQS